MIYESVIPGSLIITHFNVAYWSTVYVVKFSTINFVAYSWSVLFFIAIVCTRAESVTENRNLYRDILKKRNRHRRRYWKKTETDEKNTEKNENSVFADDDLLLSSIFIFCR